MKRTFLFLAAFLSFSLPGVAPALAQSTLGEQSPTDGKNLQAVVTENSADAKTFDRPLIDLAATSPLYGSFTLKVMNEYITRGIIVQSEGVTMQPILNVNYHLFNFGGFFNDLSLITEFWNDVSSNTKVSAPPTSAPYWTETALRAGLSLGFAKYFTLSSDFTQFLTPANGYMEGRYIKTIISCNDTGVIIPNFSFKPQFTFLYELPDSGQAGLAPHAWWFEPGITPNYNIFAASWYPLNLAIPFRIGLGEQFYAGTAYGFFSCGPQITMPLAFISSAYGKWNLTAGYTYYNLGSTTAAIAPDRRHNQNLFNAAISVAF